MRVKEKIVSKNNSDNSLFNDTKRWEEAQNVIKYTEQNGGKETTVEIPAGGVREKIAAQEKQILKHKAELSNSSKSNFKDVVSSSSEFSISSLSSFEESNHTQQDKSEKSRILLSRSNTSASLFSNDSRNENPKILKFDRKGRLVIVSKNHPFLKNISEERRKIPQSYRNALRIDNLTDKELEDLSDNYVNKVIAVGKPSFKA